MQALKDLRDEKAIPEGSLIMGNGYDDSIYPDDGKLTAADS